MDVSAQSPTNENLVDLCRRACAMEILGGVAEVDGQQLVTERLRDSRFSPPELWQQAMDVIFAADAGHPRFEQIALSRAIDEFARQYLLLTPAARMARNTELLRLTMPFPQLLWRLERLKQGVTFDASHLGRLDQATQKVAMTVLRLFCLSPEEAIRESRRQSRRICQSPHSVTQFLNGVAELNRVPGMAGILAKTPLVIKVRVVSQRPKPRLKQPRIQRELMRRNEGKPVGSWGAMNLVFLLAMLAGLLPALGRLGSQSQHSAGSYQPSSPRPGEPGYVSPRYGREQATAVAPFDQEKAEQFLKSLRILNGKEGETPESKARRQILEQLFGTLQRENATATDSSVPGLKPTSPRQMFDAMPSQPQRANLEKTTVPLPSMSSEYENDGTHQSPFTTPNAPPPGLRGPSPGLNRRPNAGSSILTPGQSN